jgi:hypothetical protein
MILLQGPVGLGTMKRLLEAEAQQGASIFLNDLAFVDWNVPDRMLFSPIVSRNLTRPLAWHLAAADKGRYQAWTLQDIMQISTPEELADAEYFAREHYGPAPPSGPGLMRPLRRQRRGCRGGKGRKRNPEQSTSFSPRIMSVHTSRPQDAYPAADGPVASPAAGECMCSTLRTPLLR